MRRSIVLADLLLGAMLASGASAQEAGVKERGLVLATQVCSACHAVRADEPIVNVASPSFKAVAESPGMSEIAIGVFLRTSHVSMPNLILSPTEIHDVGAYIMSLKAPH